MILPFFFDPTLDVRRDYWNTEAIVALETIKRLKPVKNPGSQPVHAFLTSGMDPSSDDVALDPTCPCSVNEWYGAF